jgi:hypothetical protein
VGNHFLKITAVYQLILSYISPVAIDLVAILLDISALALTFSLPSKEPFAIPSNIERSQS